MRRCGATRKARAVHVGLVLKNSAKKTTPYRQRFFEAPPNHSIRRFAAEGIIAPYPVLGTEPASRTTGKDWNARE